MSRKALIAMSGGVDSSVAALLTLEAGFEGIGCTMKLFDAPGDEAGERTCCSLHDVEDARRVAYKLGMPYYVFNFKDAFERDVIRKFVRSYECGLTPNPCIDCNRCMKFDRLFDRAAIWGCEKVVTGHYARIEYRDGSYLLKKAADSSKDQSYVLYSLGQEQLSRLLFPLGDLKKAKVRRVAAGHGLQNAEKPDSQDICFVPSGDYAAVIREYSGKDSPPGFFRDPEGRILGMHRGIIHYTVGQRKGLGISSAKPLYVQKICVETNEILLSGDEALYASEALVRNVSWVSGKAPSEPFACRVKIRYRQPEQAAQLFPLGEGQVRIRFDTPQRAITPGQAAVFYDGDTVLGGGEIAPGDRK